MASSPPNLLEGEELVATNAGVTSKSRPPSIVDDEEWLAKDTSAFVRNEDEGFFEGIYSAFTGRGKITPETEGAQEVGALLENLPVGSQIKTAIGLASSFDPEAQMQIINEAVPEAEVRSDSAGNQIITYEGKDYIINKPGFSRSDFDQALFQFISFLPAAKATNLGKTVLQKMGLAFAGGAGTSLGMDVTAEVAGAEDAISPERALAAGALGALFPAGEAVIGGIGRKLMTQPKDLSALTAQVASKGTKASKATGIGLTEPQTTLVPSFLEKQRFISQLPQGSEKAYIFLERQNQQAADAVYRFINEIAPPNAIETGAFNFRSAAQQAIKDAKGVRSASYGPLFDDAFSTGAKVEVEPVVQYLDSQIVKFPAGGSIANNLKRFRNMIARSGSLDDNLEQLHNIKAEIFEKSSKTGAEGLGPTTRRILDDVYSQLRDELVAASPKYGAANMAWREASPAVQAVENSILGTVSKMNDTQLKDIAGRIFNPAETNPAVIRKAKQAIDAVDPKAFNDLLRVEFEKRIGNIRPSTGAEIQNTPLQLRNAIFGNIKQRKILFEALDPVQRQNAKWLDEALYRASLGRAPGSPTASRQEITKELEGSMGMALRDFIGEPIKGIASLGRQAKFDRNARSMAEAIFNPKYAADMRKLRQFKNPDSPAAINAFAQMASRILADMPETEEIVQTYGE